MSVHFSSAGFADGARTVLPLAVGAALFAAALGVLAAAKGLSAVEMGFMSALVFAGASQVVAVELWAAPMPVTAIVAATLAINSRHLLMGATLRPWLAGAGNGRALGCLFFLVDESWALSMVRIREGSMDAGFLPGAGITLYAFWIAGSLLGHVFGALAPDPARLGLDFMGVAVFLSMLMLFRPGRAEILPVTITVVATVALSRILPGKWNVLLGALSGALVATFAPGREAHRG